ncbi:MAG TPA: PD-(D/E)XK nuclease family protein [Pyrinomonadaceae bacterium]|nr:PD-(D/E)XK nuclease family protein [Pyrinomonadaceae bacterium]
MNETETNNPMVPFEAAPDKPMSFAEIEEWVRETFEKNYERLRLDGGHALNPDVKNIALEQVLAYYRKLTEIAESVTDTEVRLTLPEQVTPAGRKYTIEGVVDIVRDDELTVMYDIKTHDADYVRNHADAYEKQLNVYAFIWQQLRGEPLDQTAIIATAFPERVRDAMRSGNDAVIEREMSLWNPLVDIPLDHEKVNGTIEEFGAVVDLIESKNFAPPRVEILTAEVGATRQKFGTRICRNCDARFSCQPFRNFVIATNARTGLDFARYFADFGSDEDRAARISITLDVAPPPDLEPNQ